MAQELVITSVRRGLDGGSGYQPVLRTRGMKPALAERLQIRSSYAHPYPHGDQRNPIVFVHRIERIAGQTLHVLGRFCDAGSDHTGRSNFLSHLVALEETEARRKSAGPADVARRFAYRKTWTDTPREIEQPTLIGGDPAPGPCEAWRTAGLDPGLAGDLAEAATNGSEVRLILRTKDDALALFADALTLVPPARRWAVTFNTCEIESFDATWRATREDLSQAKAWRGLPGVIDLTSPGARGSSGLYARFARGENVALPWQTQASASAGVTSVAEKSAKVSQAPASATAQSTIEPRDVPEAPPPLVSDSPPFVERPFTSPPLNSKLPAKRNYLERLETDRDHRQRREEDRPASIDALRYVVPIVVTLLLGVGVAGFVLLQLNPEFQMRIAAAWRDLAPENLPQAHSNREVNASDDATDLGEQSQSNRQQTETLDRQKRKNEEEFVSSLAGFLIDHVRSEINRASDMAKRTAEEEARVELEAKTLQRNREIAFAALKSINGITQQDLPIPERLDHNQRKAAEICKLDASHLVDFSIELAVPPEQLPDGSDFEAWIKAVQDKDLTWAIWSQGNVIVDGKNAQPIRLGSLAISNGSLKLTPDSTNILANPRFSLLRRSVLLLRAADPERPGRQEPPIVAATIQLIRPQIIGDKPLGLFTDTVPSTSWEFMTTHEFSNKVPLIPGNAHVDYDVLFGQSLEGVKSDAHHKSFYPLIQCVDRQNKPIDAWIGIKTEVSKQARKMLVFPEVYGNDSNRVPLDNIRAFLSKSETKRQEEYETFARSLREQVRKLAALQPKSFPAQKARLEDFCNEYRTYLQNAFDEPHGFEKWWGKCDALIEDFHAAVGRVGQLKDASKAQGAGREWTYQDVAPQVESVLRDWQTTYAQKLLAWCEAVLSQKSADIEYCRIAGAPLTAPLAIRINKVTCPAGKEYQVILAERDDSPAPPAAANKAESPLRGTAPVIE